MEIDLWMSFNEQLLHQLGAKVNSFYLRTHAIIFEHWLLFECCFAFVVSFIGFLEGEGTFKSCQVHLLMSDDFEKTKFKCCHLPPLHDDAEIASRTTLFEAGGDDAVRPTVIPTSSTLSSPTPYAKSPWTSKVTSIPDASPLPPHLDGILLHTPSLDHDRFTSTSTGAREEARGLKSDKGEEEEKEMVASDQFGERTGAAGPPAEPTGPAGPITGSRRTTTQRVRPAAAEPFGLHFGAPAHTPNEPVPSPAPPNLPPDCLSAC